MSSLIKVPLNLTLEEGSEPLMTEIEISADRLVELGGTEELCKSLRTYVSDLVRSLGIHKNGSKKEFNNLSLQRVALNFVLDRCPESDYKEYAEWVSKFTKPTPAIEKDKFYLVDDFTKTSPRDRFIYIKKNEIEIEKIIKREQKGKKIVDIKLLSFTADCKLILEDDPNTAVEPRIYNDLKAKSKTKTPVKKNK